VLAHVAIWSDLAVPVFNFNVYLTGYDVQTINLRARRSIWTAAPSTAARPSWSGAIRRSRRRRFPVLPVRAAHPPGIR